MVLVRVVVLAVVVVVAVVVLGVVLVVVVVVVVVEVVVAVVLVEVVVVVVVVVVEVVVVGALAKEEGESDLNFSNNSLTGPSKEGIVSRKMFIAEIVAKLANSSISTQGAAE